jgi:hypothetical protein
MTTALRLPTTTIRIFGFWFVTVGPWAVCGVA